MATNAPGTAASPGDSGTAHGQDSVLSYSDLILKAFEDPPRLPLPERDEEEIAFQLRSLATQCEEQGSIEQWNLWFRWDCLDGSHVFYPCDCPDPETPGSRDYWDVDHHDYRDERFDVAAMIEADRRNGDRWWEKRRRLPEAIKPRLKALRKRRAEEE